MRCSKCGHENASQARFCVTCGEELSNSPAPERAQLQALLESGHFASLIKTEVPENADPDLKQLLDESRRRFATTIEQMVSLYEERFGLREWNERRARTALQDFREKTRAGSAIDDPSEAEAYAEALIQEARSCIAHGETEQARARLNVLQVLPQQRDKHRLTIEALNKDISSNGRSSEPRPTTPDSPALTRRLDLPLDDRSGPLALPSPDPAADRAIDLALGSLEALEAQIERQASLSHEELVRPADQRPGWPELTTALNNAQGLVPATSPLFPRLASATNRLELLRGSVPELLAILERPLADWLKSGSNLEQTSTDLLAKLDQGFGPDRAPIPGLSLYRDRCLDEVRAVTAQLASLEVLDGEALETQFRALEQLQIPGDLPQMGTARDRVKDYQTKLKESQEKEDARKLRESRIREYSDKRRELDNLYEDADPRAESFILLRGEASAIASTSLLTPNENPLDPETFAYYDLLFASRYRTLTAPSELANLAQTQLGKGDYLQAFRTHQKSVTDLEGGDDKLALQTARTLLHNARAALLKNLEETAREALASVQRYLSLFDYRAADQTLETQRKYISDAGIKLDPQLLEALDRESKATQELATRERNARDLIERADQLTQPGSPNPDYPGALEALDKAAQIASWLQASIERQAEQVRLRRSDAVDGQIKLAEVRIKGGTLAAFAEAEKLLSSAEKNASQNSELGQIKLLRDKIEDRRNTIEQIEQLRATAFSLADDARAGTNLDLLPGRIIQTRHRIGPQDDKRIDEGNWAEIERFLTTAEERLGAREEFNGLVTRAEQAALLGKEQDFTELLSAITDLTSRHTFLKLGTAEALARQARQGSRIERARQYIDKIRRKLEESDQTLSADEINSAILTTEDYDSDEEIKKDRAFLGKMLPLYRDRDLLKNALRVSDFAEFDRIYQRLGTEIQSDPRISRLKQEAEIERARALFQQGYDTLQREAKARFRDGWDNPDKLVDFVSRLRAFADQLPAAQRSEEPALAPTIIGELESLTETLVGARADYENLRYPAALRRIESALSVIPVSPTQGTLIDAYASTLAYLRTVLTGVREEINGYIKDGDGDKNLLSGAIEAYNSCVGNPQEAFNKAKLVAVRNRFMLPVSRQRMAERDGYAQILKRITDLIDDTDAIEDLIISGHSRGEQAPTKQSGAERLAMVEQHINALITESKEIRNTPEGASWLGIQEYVRFRALSDHRRLARDLAEAEQWLERARGLQQPVANLRRLRADAENLNLSIVGSKIESDLRQADCMVLIEKCKDFSGEINIRVPKIQAEIKRRESQSKRTIGTGVLLVILIALGFVAWNVAALHDPIVVALIGTLTPVPSPVVGTPVGSGVIVVTATPIPTITPIPTPTPIPPQAGIVIIPGTANVRAKPNINFERVGIVEAGDVIQVTGFTTEPDGTLWYRLDVPERHLLGVWLLAKVTVQGQSKQTIRLEGGAELNPALQLQYES